MNTVSLIGRLTREIEIRCTKSGKAVGNGTLAVDRYSKGEKKADFVPFVIWDKQAENLANFTRKGSKIAIKGSIQTRNYENSEGVKHFVVEVLVDGFNGFELLENKNHSNDNNQTYRNGDYQTSNNQQGGYQQNRQSSYQNNNQNNQYGSYQNNNQYGSEPITIDPEDLPF